MNRVLADRWPFLADLLASPAARQLVRYAFAGFCVTQLAAGIYSALVLSLAMRPLEANVASTVCGLAIGYAIHSRWSFAGASADAEHAKIARFLLTSLLAFVVNSAWVFLLVSVMHLPPLAPVPLMMFATPWLSFLLNRHWVFRAA
ncbi:MAG TPA: GtrA family protein [Sphingomicrobium sp.]|nr:GtrA family protein [Sphingomicrobium sp.]